MSVEETRVKREPDEHSSNDAAEVLYTYQVPIKYEVNYDDEGAEVKSEIFCESGASVDEDAGLYTDRGMKDEVVRDPELMESPCPEATSVTLYSNLDASETQNTPSTSHHAQEPIPSSLLQVEYKNDNVPPLTHQSLQARYVCDICQKEFARTDLLRIHRRTHTGEKPYSCNICKREFAQLAHLKGHVMIHTGEKPYPCKKCDMGFRQLSSLKRHERSHAGEKPHACNVCGKRFTRKGQVVKHKMSRHKVGA